MQAARAPKPTTSIDAEVADELSAVWIQGFYFAAYSACRVKGLGPEGIGDQEDLPQQFYHARCSIDAIS